MAVPATTGVRQRANPATDSPRRTPELNCPISPYKQASQVYLFGSTEISFPFSGYGYEIRRIEPITDDGCES